MHDRRKPSAETHRFGEILREAKGELTEAQAAEKIGMSYGMFRNLVSGHRAPSYHALKKICRVFPTVARVLLEP